ncbi:MAG: hypothetical protein KDK74_01490 [Cephaloticoccus sp.]|nr:hypothetical protein [Cephaloticoccus sp.]
MIPLLAGMPVDFVFIDTEHIPIDRHDLAYMCYAFDASGLAPIVRIPTPDPYVAGQVVDNGAVAVVAPYVETVEQVRTLVGAVKKRPLKGRKLAQEIEGSVPFEPELSAYVQKHNAGLSVIVNIESVPAIEVLDEILAVEGLDAILIGPHDLSCSLGLPEQYEDPRFEAAMVDLFQRARSAGVGAGVHSWMDPKRESIWCAAGANLMIHSSDIWATRDGLTHEINALRRLMGDEKIVKKNNAATV